MLKTVALKPEEIAARDYADRLLLEQLTELDEVMKVSELADRLHDVGLSLSTVKSLLASNPERFAYNERRWIPAARLAVAGRPFEQAIRSTLDAFGGPMQKAHLTLELSRALELDEETTQNIVDRLVEKNRAFVLDAFDRISLTDWGFNIYDQKRERAFTLNHINEGAFTDLQKKLVDIDFRDSNAVQKALEIAAPISLKLLGAVAWTQLNPEDPRSLLMYEPSRFLKEVLSVPGFIYGADGVMTREEDSKKWLNLAARFADKLAPTVDVDDALPIEIKTEDIPRLVAKIISANGSVTATQLLEEFYEITLTNKTYPDDLHNIMKALQSEKGIVWVGGDRFQKEGLVPDYILTLPEAFSFPNSGVLNGEGELVDIELSDDGLSQTLRKLLSHPLAIDVNDEDDEVIPPKIMPDTLRLVLKSIHRELGTFPICQFPRGWIADSPSIQELILQDQEGREIQVWVNQKDRMTYNWIDWWFEQSIENGAVFTLTRTNRPNVIEFAWQEQPDPVVFISAQRMEQLRTIGQEFEGRSTLDILIEIMTHWSKGADYLTILAEMNIARRSSRRLVASLLSSYQCFYQRSGSPVWHFDAKKVELGVDKSKLRFVLK